MKGKISLELRAIMREPKAREKLVRILDMEADDNIVEMPDGTRYVIDNYSGRLSSFYKDKQKR